MYGISKTMANQKDQLGRPGSRVIKREGMNAGMRGVIAEAKISHLGVEIYRVITPIGIQSWYAAKVEILE